MRRSKRRMLDKEEVGEEQEEQEKAVGGARGRRGWGTGKEKMSSVFKHAFVLLSIN